MNECYIFGFAGSSAAGVVQFDGDLPSLKLDRAVNVAELRRHKRGFMKLATQLQFARLTDAAMAKRMFIDYLQNNLQ